MENGDPAIMRLTYPPPDGAAVTMFEAYTGDPLMDYVLPPEFRSERLALRFIEIALDYGVLYGEAYASSDMSGVAIWLPPHHREMGLWGLFRTGLLFAPFRMGRKAFRRLQNVVGFTHEIHCVILEEPHWYLYELAVRPDSQRRGLGGALIAPVLVKADREGYRCYLETFTDSAEGFYRKHGFETVHREASPKGGPICRFMIREPR